VADYSTSFDSFDDVESLVRSASDYVQASPDLRPRVLESARTARRERCARRRIGQMAVLVALLGLFIAAVRQQPETVASRRPAAASGAARLLSDAQQVVGYSDSSWEMVESFTELRRRQAELLRPAL